MVVLVLVLVALGLTEWFLYRAIRRQAASDEARPADAIMVFGAAEYNGRPSRVFKSRLDHAFELEERGLAPVLITTGAGGGDPHFTEAGVGRDYLIQKGMAAQRIISETRSETSYESVKAVTRLLRERHGITCIAVSDGFHLYRIKTMFRALGITAFGSPAPDSPIESDPFDRALHSAREAIVMTLWYLGLRS